MSFEVSGIALYPWLINRTSRICGYAIGVLMASMSVVPARPSVMEFNPEVEDVPEAVRLLAFTGEWLGCHMGSATDRIPDGVPNAWHIQGIARAPRVGDAPYLYITSSGELRPSIDNFSKTSKAELLVVHMASRNRVGERLRSNRLDGDHETVNTQPRSSDRVEPSGPSVRGNFVTVVDAGTWAQKASLDEWRHLRLTFDVSSTMECWIDGELVATRNGRPNLTRNRDWQLTLGNFEG